MRFSALGQIRFIVSCAIVLAAFATPLRLRAALVTGLAREVGSNIVGGDGIVYDLVVMEGGSATVQADPGQSIQVSFIDQNDDIVMVAFSGAGSLTVTFQTFTGPAMPTRYNTIASYVKGSAALSIVGCDGTTKLKVYTSGRNTSLNQALFRNDVTYDGIADLVSVSIAVPSSTTSPFGVLDLGNVRFSGSAGVVGVAATDVQFAGAISLHDIDASGTAMPILVVGSATEVQILGGDLAQSNGAPLRASGPLRIRMMAGTNSHGASLPTRSFSGQLTPSSTLTGPIVVTPLAAEFTAGIAGTFAVGGVGSPAPTFSIVQGALPSWASLNASTGIISGTPPSELGSPLSFEVQLSNGVGDPVKTNVSLSVAPAPVVAPDFVTHPLGADVFIGTSFTLSAFATGEPAPGYQWRKNGADLAGATSSTLQLAAFAASDAGFYSVVATNPGGSVESAAVFVGASSTGKVAGLAAEIASDIRHPNGNRYDQVALQGASALIKSEGGDITRISFVDASNDIVQVEFFGAGNLSLSLEDASGPAAPLFYNQPNSRYMKGLPRIVVTGANETTNLTVFTVGRATAIDPSKNFDALKPISAENNPANNGSSLFIGHEATDYDGVADLVSITIASVNGKFGGLRTANASYSGTAGLVGVYAPNVEFTGPVFMGDISATAAAIPVIVLGAANDVRITGGDLEQPNHRAVNIQGVSTLQFRNGSTSHGELFPARTNKGRLERDGIDVTAQVAQPPSP